MIGWEFKLIKKSKDKYDKNIVSSTEHNLNIIYLFSQKKHRYETNPIGYFKTSDKIF